MDYEEHEWSELDPTVQAWLEHMRKRSQVSWGQRLIRDMNPGMVIRGVSETYSVLDETRRAPFARYFMDMSRKAGKTSAMNHWLEDTKLWEKATVDGDALADDGPGGDAERDRLRETLTLVTVYDCEMGCLAELTTPDGRRFYGFDAASPAR